MGCVWRVGLREAERCPLKEAVLSKVKVLVIDSSLLDVMKIEKVLHGRGYEVVRLTSPHGVLAKIDYENPDVLLIDPWTPRLDAPEVLATVASAPKFEDMVVVAIGNRDAATLQAFCVEHDLHGYFSKTMDLDGLGVFLDNFFEEE